MKSILKSISLGLLLVTTLTVNAQSDFGGQAGIDLGSAMANQVLMNVTLNPNAPGAANKTRTKPGTRSPNLVYSPTPALKRQTVQAYVERLKTKNPAASQAVAANFGSGRYDYGTIYNGLVKGNGLRSNDAVDAMVAYMVLGYMIVNNLQDGNAVTPSMVQGVRAQFGPRLSQSPSLSAPGVVGQLGEEMKLQFVIVQGGWQSAIKENKLLAYQQGIGAIFKTQWGLDFTKLTLSNEGFSAKTRATIDEPALPSSSSPTVEGWFFRAVSSYPAAVAFEPVVLFKNGDYFEVGESPLEMLNAQQARQSRPTAWGKWQKKGMVYSLTNSKNQSTDYKLGSGNWFPAYPYRTGTNLKKGYKRVSGGDYGNGTAALATTKINFLDATHFSEGLNAGISSPNAAGWKKSNTVGTYKLQGNTLELTYNDGKVVRKSFALGATGTPPRPTTTLIFIGGDAYTDTD